MHRLRRRGVELTVPYAGSSAHSLNVAWFDDRPIAEAVPVLKGAFQHISNYLHVAVAVCGEARSGPDPILVDHAQLAKPHLGGLVVIAEGERVSTIQPVDQGSTARGSFSYFDHPEFLRGCLILTLYRLVLAAV